MTLNKTWCEISTTALRGNVKALKARLAEGALLGVVVKSNAYGHGLEICVPEIIAAGADWLIVNDIDEACAVRALSSEASIYICGPHATADADRVAQSEARVVVYDEAQLRALDAAGIQAGRTIPVHLKVETGCNRLGLAPESCHALAKLTDALEGVTLEGLTTHFADVEDTTNHSYARGQLERLYETVQSIRDSGIEVPMVHAANSAATILWPDAHDALVRAGISSYGFWPSKETLATALQAKSSDVSVQVPDLQPSLSWKARVAQVKDVPAGSYVGYGRTYRTTSKTRLAVLPVGYYEGYKRDLSSLAHVLIAGERAPVRGRVCMNMLMVDVTHIPEVSVGSVATLIGNDGSESITADLMAQWAGTIHYEIVASIHPSIPRIAV